MIGNTGNGKYAGFASNLEYITGEGKGEIPEGSMVQAKIFVCTILPLGMIRKPVFFV